MQGKVVQCSREIPFLQEYIEDTAGQGRTLSCPAIPDREYDDEVPLPTDMGCQGPVTMLGGWAICMV
jgi:hypothetical protein